MYRCFLLIRKTRENWFLFWSFYYWNSWQVLDVRAPRKYTCLLSRYKSSLLTWIYQSRILICLVISWAFIVACCLFFARTRPKSFYGSLSLVLFYEHPWIFMIIIVWRLYRKFTQSEICLVHLSSLRSNTNVFHVIQYNLVSFSMNKKDIAHWYKFIWLECVNQFTIVAIFGVKID